MQALSASPTTPTTRQLGSSTTHRVIQPSHLPIRVSQPSQLTLRCNAFPHNNSDEKSTPVNGHPSIQDIFCISNNDPNQITTTTTITKSNLPQPLSNQLSPQPSHGSTLRVAYQGVPGAYSEAAAGKAYPGSEAIPCDQFEVFIFYFSFFITSCLYLNMESHAHPLTYIAC